MAFFSPFRPAYQADPYPALARLRREEPVHRSTELNAWVITSYEGCDVVLHDDRVFSSDPVNARGPMGESIAALRSAVPLGSAPILGNSDAPVHTRLRAIVNRAFTPRAIESVTPRVEAIAAELLGTLAAQRVELMAGFIEPFVVFTVLEQLGIPHDDRPVFREHARAILAARAEGPQRLPEAERATTALTGLLDAWRSAGVPQDTVLGTLLTAAEGGERMTPDEMLMTLIHISSAGNGPTACAIGNAVLALAEHPQAITGLLDSPDLLPSAVEETLRFDSPTHMVARFAMADSSLGSRRIRKGDVVYAVIGAANRDPAQFERPDEFDIARSPNRHLSFGVAVHFCLGAPLARVMIRTALAALLGRYGRFRLFEMQRGGTLLLRGPARLVIGPE